MSNWELGSSQPEIRALSVSVSSPSSCPASSLSAYHFYYDYYSDLFYDLTSSLYFERVRGLFSRLSCFFLLVAYCLMILVSGGIFLAVVILPFVGYKLYTRFISKCGGNPVVQRLFFCCHRRRGSQNEQVDGPGNMRRRPKVVPKVQLDFKSGLRVGETVSFRVIFPITPLDRSIDTRSLSLRERGLLEKGYNLDLLSIEVVKVSGAPSTAVVTPMRELITCNSSNNISSASTGSREDILLVTFLVQESGFYQINVVYAGEHISGSPFPTPFNPADLDAEKTICAREASIILSVSGELLIMHIRPRDRYGNECNYGDVDTSKFTFKLIQAQDQPSATGSKDPTALVDANKNERTYVEAVVFNFTREIKKLLAEESYLEALEVKLEAEIFLPGVFQGLVSYGGVTVQNGLFDVVVLSPGEHNSLRGIMGSNPGSRYHEARLTSLGSEIQKKVRPIYLYVNSKTLTVREFFFAGLIPYRIATFRILPATKVQLLLVNLEAALTTFVIIDRIQPAVTIEMDTTNFRIILAMFALFLKQRLGGSESFENKQKFFYDELRNSKEALVRATAACINVQRSSLVSSSLSETKGFSTKDWCKNFKIKFMNEEGSDDGGLRREWLNLVCREVFENNTDGMFCSMGNSRLVHPNPSRDQSKWPLKYYELAGKVVGKCLFETSVGGFYKQMVNARFSRSFLAQIIGFTPHFKYFEQDDPELYIAKVKYMLENDVEVMDLTFVEEEYSSSGQLIKTVDLLPNGRKLSVTNENKVEYLNALAQYRLSFRVKREIEFFLKGLGEIVPEGLLTNFDENELEILLCGKSTFRVDDLQINHVESGEGVSYLKLLPWFWICLTNMTDEERARLLQFTTGSSLLPHGGFKELQPTFRITVYDTYGKLPIAHTCFNEICLSEHRTFEEFEKALKIAINEGSEGFAIM